MLSRRTRGRCHTRADMGCVPAYKVGSLSKGQWFNSVRTIQSIYSRYLSRYTRLYQLMVRTDVPGGHVYPLKERITVSLPRHVSSTVHRPSCPQISRSIVRQASIGSCVQFPSLRDVTSTLSILSSSFRVSRLLLALFRKTSMALTGAQSPRQKPTRVCEIPCMEAY